ncbi:hypothetical protein RRG08_022627 [Elysia crispata]|uniref:Uncharacterized protein n=1 Tax=Elysia crispata TaxID=231223 RepID=A0AAE0Z1W1_9GAST|nr:hypothetical protein RRG08_022627 [Elysia crispata]
MQGERHSDQVKHLNDGEKVQSRKFVQNTQSRKVDSACRDGMSKPGRAKQWADTHKGVSLTKGKSPTFL